MSFPTEINAIPAMAQDSDGNRSETFTVPATAPYIYDLGANAPLSYPSGYRIVPPSGIANVVTISGASQTWTEVTTSPASAGQFQVDYSASPTGGRLTFSAADAGKTATVTYYGATLVNETLMQAIISALKTVVSARSAANGLAALDANQSLLVPGHIILSGSTPTVANAGGSGVSSVSISGQDSCGIINVATSGSPASGNLATVTFAHAFGATPKVLYAVQGNNPALQLWTSAASTTAFTVAANVTPNASTTYGIVYLAIQTS